MILAVAYLALINVVTFAVFAVDKGRAARGGRRVREATLLGLAAIGGTAGALAGQAVLRHKTRKQPFVRWLWAIAFSQVLAGAAGWAMLNSRLPTLALRLITYPV